MRFSDESLLIIFLCIALLPRHTGEIAAKIIQGFNAQMEAPND